MSEAVANITGVNPRSSFQESEIDAPVSVWIQESYILATTFVYRMGLQENGLPSEEYLKEGAKLAQRQIAKGGYRLANLLVKLWGNLETQQELFLE